MFGGVGFGAERIGFAALKYPKTAALCLLALLVLIGLSLPRVTFDNDINRVFLSDSALSQAQRSYERDQTPPTSTVLIQITSPIPLTAEDMNALRHFSKSLEDVDGVSAVASPFALRWPLTEGLRSGTPVFGERIDESFGETLSTFNDLATGLPSFLNHDLTTMILNVLVDTDQAAIPEAVAAISAELDDTLPKDLSAHITGEDVISAEIVSGLKEDLIALNLWGVLIVTLAAFALLRDLRMAFLAVVPAIFGSAGVLALSVWLGYPITVLSNVIPILLLVLGVADGMHLSGHIKENGTVQGAMEKVAPACALTALTTAVAFASIMLTGNEQMFEFAILGAVGTLLAFVIIIVSFALLGHVISLSDRPVPRLSASIAKKVARVGSRWPRITITSCLTLLVISVAGFTQTKAWFPLYQNLPDNSATLATNDAVSRDFGGVFSLIVETDGDWKQTRDLVEKLEAINGPQTILSEVNIAKWLGHSEARPKTAELDKLPEALVGPFRAGGKTSRIFVSVPEPMRSDETLVHFDALYDTARAAGATRILGLPTIMRQEAVKLIEQLSFGLVVATLGAICLCAFAFRSVRLIPVLAVPNILPLMLTGASLHFWAQGQLTPTAVLALTISFGIAIDDTVHFLNRFAEAKARGNTSEQAVASATKEAGQVMVLTTLLLTVGLSVTLFSDFTPIRLFGGMMIVTLWAALLIDLLLLPALLSWKKTSTAFD